MNTIAQIKSHRSIRKFKQDPIPDDVLNQILETAIRASSSGNIQPYSIIITKDHNNRKELWKLHYKQDMILEAPLLLTFCVDWNRMIKWCWQMDANPGYDNFLCFMVGTGDAFIIAQNAALAAEHFGLGICFMGTTLNNAKKIAKFFNCPKGVMPITTLVVGYPDETPAKRDRLPLKGVIHDEKYHDYNKDEIEKIYKLKETEGWKRYMSSPELKEKIEKANVKNVARIYTDVKYQKEEMVNASKNLLEIITEQGFINL